MLKKIAVSAALAILCGSAAWASQGSGAPSRANLPQFHAVHVSEVEIGCTDCHRTAERPAPGQELSFDLRPGHDQCNICHEEAFEAGEFVTLCLTCHSNDTFDLGKFPTGRSSIGPFPHAKHLDPKGRVSASTGQRGDCVYCHNNPPAGQTDPGFPGHPQCKSCHAGSDGLAPMIAKGADQACQSCHDIKKIDYTIKNRGAATAAGLLPPWLAASAAPQESYGAGGGQGSGHLGSNWADIKRFPHDKHVKERDGAGINCIVCHEPLAQQTDPTVELRYPGMDQCAVCHQNASRVGKENVIGECKACHLEIDEGTVPGENGLLARIAHNPGFRINHQNPARDSSNYCQYCHQLQRVSGNACADCHQVLQPETHLAARFGETTHGRLAAMDRENCAVCHESDFCIRCHNIPPRSHSPLPLFAAGLHRDLAALNLRSCFACHTFEENCVDCHERTLRTP